MVNPFQNSPLTLPRAIFIAITAAVVAGLTGPAAMSENAVDLTMSQPGSCDTIYANIPATFDIWIANDVLLNSISLGFRIFSPDGATWTWNLVDGDMVTVVPGSRADSSCIWDPTGLLVTPEDINGVSPDTLYINALAMFCGLAAGPLEHMYSAHFTAHVTGDDIRVICIDSTWVPPAGAFVFADASGSSFPPVALWPWGGRCRVVAVPRECVVVWDEGLPDTMFVTPPASATVVLSGHNHFGEPIRYRLEGINGGMGTAEVTDNGDGTCDVTYTASPDDNCDDIYISVGMACGSSPYSVSPDYVLRAVVDRPLTLSCGNPYNLAVPPFVMTKADIMASDDDTCDQITYFLSNIFPIPEGDFSLDAAAGVFTFQPTVNDYMLFDVVVGATNGRDSVECGFEVDVVSEECCAGDANSDGNVNVADGVYVVNYVFRSGQAPPVTNWADANDDCQVNVGDAVYLINYVFRSGNPPEPGCLY